MKRLYICRYMYMTMCMLIVYMLSKKVSKT